MLDVDALAVSQIGDWRGRRLDQAEIYASLKHRVNAHVHTFLFELDGSDVILRPAEHIVKLQLAGHQLEVVRRALIFVRLFRDTLLVHPLRRPLTLAIDMSDLAKHVGDLPIFSFQKNTGSPVIALPDHEIVGSNYLEDVDADDLPFVEKRNAAFFSGSTTGVADYTLDDLAASRVPRIRAARYFKNCEDVDFFLPNVCQFATEDVRTMLLSEGFGNGIPIQLSEGYKYKFSILMDGNGATCSRTAIVLHSNSALLRYESSYELFYTSALVAGEHFVPISQETDVVAAIAQERRNPGRFASIAQNGKCFAQSVLTRVALIGYTSALLNQYGKLFYGEE